MKKPEKGTGELSEIRSKPGESGAFKHKSSKFAGPEHTFPIGDLPHARNALARAHFAKNPESIKNKVYKEYPSLKKHHEERMKHKDNIVSNFGRPHKEMGHMSKDAKSDYAVTDMKKYDRRNEDKRYKAYK
jgi:hypothetical protein